MAKIVLTALALSSLVIGVAICAKPARAETSQTYQDVMRKCGAEWKASEARKSVQKGQGREAWNTFRKECVQRNPYQKKQRNTRG